MNLDNKRISPELRSELVSLKDGKPVDIIVRLHQLPDSYLQPLGHSSQSAPLPTLKPIVEGQLYSGTVDQATLHQLAKNHSTAIILPDVRLQTIPPADMKDTADITPLEADWKMTWGLHVLDLSALRAQHSQTDTVVRVGVIDSGCADHPALRLKTVHSLVVDGQDLNDMKVVAAPRQDVAADAHGTHVCGTICGGSAAGIVYGIAPNVELYVVNIHAGGGPSVARLLHALHYFSVHGIDIVNMSISVADRKWSTINWQSEFDPVLDPSNMLAVAAVGNSGDGHVEFPARMPSVVSVGAVAYELEEQRIAKLNIAWFSGGGILSSSINNTSSVNPLVVAPGVDVVSLKKPDGYQYMSGTSMAAPHVTGVAALLKMRHPDASAGQIREAIIGSAWHPGLEKRPDSRWGYGMIQPMAAALYLDRLMKGINYGEE